jgi:hypothetical protein
LPGQSLTVPGKTRAYRVLDACGDSLLDHGARLRADARLRTHLDLGLNRDSATITTEGFVRVGSDDRDDDPERMLTMPGLESAKAGCAAGTVARPGPIGTRNFGAVEGAMATIAVP